MDTEKPLSGKEAKTLKTRTGRLPVIEEKKVIKGKTYCRRSPNTLLKPRLNFPKLKVNEVPQKRADAGEPGHMSSEILNQPTNSAFASSILGAHFSSLNSLEEKSEEFVTSPKVVGISECQVGFKVPSSELITDDLETEEEDLEESNALKRWKYWLRDKIHVQNVLSRKLGRHPCDLQIQESDKYRAIFEDKLLLTYAQIPKPDKWRGHPFHWKQKFRLGPRNVPDYCDIPIYEAVETKVDTGELPEVEFIGIPSVIQKEKDRKCRFDNASLKKWEKNPYRREQIVHFKDQRKKMKPHEVLMDDLAVVGVKITEKQEESIESIKTQNTPEIVVTEEDTDCLDFRPSIFCLVIEGGEIKYEIGSENCQNPDIVFYWQVDFGTNKIGSLVEKTLRIENRGTIAVAYDWISKKSQQKQDLNSVQPKLHEPWFFFNKNSGLFLPGQIYNLKFYHRSEFSGIRKEVWHLKTKPPLWKNQEMGTVVLSAVATEDFSSKKVAVESFLKKRVGETVVRYILKVLFYKVFNPSEGLRDIEYRSLFNEKELFEYHNPKHYYNSSIVGELKELFKEIPCKCQTHWDLSLSSMVSEVKTSIQGKEKNDLLQKIADASRKLYRPNYLRVKKCNKRKMTYEILCKMATLMEEDYNYIKNLLFRRREFTSNFSFKTEEAGEDEYSMPVVYDIKPMDFIFFQTMLYTKVYDRLCEAVESIVGMIETNRLLEPCKQGCKPIKPSRRHR